MNTYYFDIRNHFWDQRNGTAPDESNGTFYVSYSNVYSTSTNAAYGGVNFYAGTDNNQSDHWVVDLTFLGNYDAGNLDIQRLFFSGDNYGYTSDEDELETFDVILPKDWSMVWDDKSSYVFNLGQYYNLYDASGARVNLNDGQFWFMGTRDNINITNICFAHGTRLLCADGEWRAVEEIEEGDLVMTKDAGLQPVKWAGHSPVSRETLEQFPNRRPIVFEPGAVGNTERLRVSPQHRMLVTGAIDGGPAEERLVPAKHLVNDHSIYVDNSCESVRYYHIMMDQHHVVMSEGTWSESFWPGAYIRDVMDPLAWAQVEFHFPELATNANPNEAYSRPAREFLKRKHVDVFLQSDML